MRLHLGIDPGLTGACAVLTEAGEYCEVFDVPTMANGKGSARVKQQINAAALAARLAPLCEKHVVTATLEAVSAMPGQGVSGVFSLGHSFGTIYGVLATLKVPVELITPARWKKAFQLLGTEKETSRALAIRLYPHAAEWLARKKDHGRAEALLLARFGWQSGHGHPVAGEPATVAAECTLDRL